VLETGLKKSFERDLGRFFKQPRIISFLKLWKISKMKSLIHLTNGLANITYPIPFKKEDSYFWFEWSYNLWRSRMRELHGEFGENSLRSPTAWWRQSTHALGGFFMALPINLIIFFSFEMATLLLSPMGFVLGFSIWKESKDIEAEGERRKNSLDVVFWVFGAFLNGIFFMIFKDRPF